MADEVVNSSMLYLLSKIYKESKILLHLINTESAVCIPCNQHKKNPEPTRDFFVLYWLIFLPEYSLKFQLQSSKIFETIESMLFHRGCVHREW